MNAPVTANEILQQGRREPTSQATSIEQSRAVAEVQAAVTVAQRCPRNEAEALNKAMATCKMIEVAETAFFKLPRGKESVTGETIHLAVELARCWGNISYGVMELDRDDHRGHSEMLAFAWDLETNSQSRMTFIVPHKRDTKHGAKALVDMRDIYENNANMGARRLRECIFRVLPAWLKERAKAECYQTLERGEGEAPLPVRIADALSAFEGIGVSVERLEGKFGASSGWTATDVVQMQVSFRSIKRREISADDEFPRIGVQETADAAKRLVAGTASNVVADLKQDAAEPETGRADADHGDQNDGTDSDHPARKIADEIIRAAEVAPDLHHVAQLRGLRGPDISAMPDELALEVVRALNAAEAKLGGKTDG